MSLDDDNLRSFLAARDYPCPVCRYNLRGLDGASCPECGARLDLQVGSIDLKLGPWLTCVLAAAVPLGFNGIMALIGTVVALRSSWRWDSGDSVVLAICSAATMACAGLLLVICRRRRRFLRRPAADQWRRATALVVAMGVVEATVIWAIYLAQR